MRKCALIVCACAAVWTAGAGEIHVSPNGDDAGAGTAAAPLRTLSDAVARARAAAGARIVLADGTYETAEPFVLTAADRHLVFEAAPRSEEHTSELQSRI